MPFERKYTPEEAKQKIRESQARYRKNNCKTISFMFYKNTEADIIKKLEEQPNKTGYIKNLIRKDIKDNETD